MAQRILGSYRECMTDDDSLEAYNNFIENAGVSEDRIIQALEEMGSEEDVAGIFKCFPNGTEVKFQEPGVDSSSDLIINDQLPIHPKALATLYNSKQPSQTENDLRRIVDLTGSFNPNLSEDQKKIYRDNVNKVLQTHRMCTLEEKRAWTEQIKEVLEEVPAYAILFENMSLAEAFDLKTVFQYTNGTIIVGLRLAEMMDCVSNIEKIINCIEIINVAVDDARQELERDWKQAENKTFSCSSLEKEEEFSKLREYYLIKSENQNLFDLWATPSTQNQVGMKTRFSAWKKEVAHRWIEKELVQFQKKLETEMGTIGGLCQSIRHKWEHSLTATCHFRKHHELTVKLAETFYGPTDDATQKREIYFENVPESLFTLGNKKHTAPYQNGLRGYTRYLQDQHFFGVKSHTLDYHNLDSSIVLTHYVPNKKILDAYSSEI